MSSQCTPSSHSIIPSTHKSLFLYPQPLGQGQGQSVLTAQQQEDRARQGGQGLAQGRRPLLGAPAGTVQAAGKGGEGGNAVPHNAGPGGSGSGQGSGPGSTGSASGSGGGGGVGGASLSIAQEVLDTITCPLEKMPLLLGNQVLYEETYNTIQSALHLTLLTHKRPVL